MYAIWKACERFGIKPPFVKDRWDDCDPGFTQANLISYDQIRSLEEAELACLRLPQL